MGELEFDIDGEVLTAELLEEAAPRSVEAFLPTAEEMETGTYQLLFGVGAYYRQGPSESTFLETVPVRFLIGDPEEHHHALSCCHPAVARPTGVADRMRSALVGSY